MQQTLEVIYEGGVFRPITLPDTPIGEGQRLRIAMLPVEQPEENVLEMMFHFYDDVPEEEQQEIKKIILDRRDFFGDKADA